jgi:hypothetical protein
MGMNARKDDEVTQECRAQSLALIFVYDGKCYHGPTGRRSTSIQIECLGRNAQFMRLRVQFPRWLYAIEIHLSTRAT